MEIRNFLREKRVFLIALFSFLVRLYRLNEPSNLVFDEEVYLGELGFSKSHHPPLGCFVFWLSRKTLGGNPWGWRLPSVLAGTFLVPLVYFFSLRLFKSKLIAFGSALFLSFESLTFIHSRLATIDILVTFFIVAGGYFLVKASKSTSLFPLVASCLFLGLALSTKWSAVFPWLAILILAAIFDRRLVFSLFFLPVLVYLVTFSLINPGLNQLIDWHRQTLLFHTQKQEGFNLELASPFWSWPLLFSPVTYFRAEKFTPGKHMTQVINASGNIPLFWAFFPAFGFLVWEIFKSWRGGKGDLTINHLGLTTYFFSSWFPWAFSPRPTFAYYFLPAVPFGCMAVAYWLEKVWRHSGFRPLVLGYLALVLGFFVFLYPTFTAFPIPEKVFDLVKKFG